jgi:hypothetical protein
MQEITREMIQDQLKDGWGIYLAKFTQLSSNEQRSFLDKQGYATLSGLLGHVVAWWELGKYTIEQILIDPDFQNAHIEVDLFNARAVERFADCGDAEIAETFETMLQAMLDFVDDLPDRAFENKRVNERLYVEIMDHFEEHQ